MPRSKPPHAQVAYRLGCSWPPKHISRQLDLPLPSPAVKQAIAENARLYLAVVDARKLGHTVYRNGNHIFVDGKRLSSPDFVDWIEWRRRQ